MNKETVKNYVLGATLAVSSFGVGAGMMRGTTPDYTPEFNTKPYESTTSEAIDSPEPTTIQYPNTHIPDAAVVYVTPTVYRDEPVPYSGPRTQGNSFDVYAHCNNSVTAGSNFTSQTTIAAQFNACMRLFASSPNMTERRQVYVASQGITSDMLATSKLIWGKKSFYPVNNTSLPTDPK